MVAAVEVQELAKAGTGRPAPAMAAPGAALGDQARVLEGELHKSVGERHAVIPARDVEEVADVKVRVPCAIELQDPLNLGAGGRPVRRSAAAAVEQPQDRIPLIPRAPAP